MKELISDHLWDGNPSYDSLSLYLNQVLVFIMGVLRTRGFIRTGGKLHTLSLENLSPFVMVLGPTVSYTAHELLIPLSQVLAVLVLIYTCVHVVFLGMGVGELYYLVIHPISTLLAYHL